MVPELCVSMLRALRLQGFRVYSLQGFGVLGLEGLRDVEVILKL